ncbi:unnamed protein product [Symbiodinium pilosum]|uniref:Uncharacterized protein n=1 Tax=Symbiodinium pilosum TaxID=2952 RepID=A0A812WTJ5_SYMPI|nr:unnamed protein product [Symbiodinium pilosum]
MATRTETCTEVAVRAAPNPFHWEVLEDEPKVQRTCIGRLFRSTEYEILHTGGFVRLCTERGRVYWLAQNEHDHRLPDWKLHFSVAMADVPRAWNVLSEIFLNQACDFGMKAVAGEALDSWPDEQRGRELTVYIFQDHPAYKGGGPMMGYCPGFEHNFWLGPEFERASEFWLDFVVQAETALAGAGIRSRGTANGDLSLGHYASLRNEAFIFDPSEGLYIYPPNDSGWNAAGHSCPLQLPLPVRLGLECSAGLAKLRRLRAARSCCNRRLR